MSATESDYLADFSYKIIHVMLVDPLYIIIFLLQSTAQLDILKVLIFGLSSRILSA